MIHRLHTELAIRVLEHLPRQHLHVVSRVSRQFYTLTCGAGRAIHRTIYFTPDHDFQAALATFRAVVSYALKNQHHERPGVSLRLACQCSEDERVALMHGFTLILDALTESLPVLVGLEAYVPSFFCMALYDALREPAPRLRRLGLGQGKDDTSLALLPPEDLLNGSAHRLNSVCLAFPALPPDWRPPVIFRRVTCAQLTLYRASHFTRPSRILPRLNSLFLDLEYNNPQLQPLEINLSGLQLDHLALADVAGPPSVISGISIHAIPVFERTAIRSLDANLWSVEGAPSAAPLCASVTRWRETLEPLVSIASTTGPWIRTAAASVSCSARFSIIPALAITPAVGSRIVTLMIDDEYLSRFFKYRGSLPAVLDIHIFLSVGYDDQICLTHLDGRSRPQVNLPALRRVTLLALGNVAHVRVEHVAVLGQILRQDVRHAESRAALRMMGVSFVRPCMYKRVDAVFSAVQEHLPVDPNVQREADACSSHIQSPFRVPGWVYR